MQDRLTRTLILQRIAILWVAWATPMRAADGPPAIGSPSIEEDSAGQGVAGNGSRRAFETALSAFQDARSYAETHVTDQQESRRRYRVAGQGFVDAWQSGWTSTEVLTNAANAFAFAGDNGLAVLFYRRALSVDPSNARAQSGLEYLRSGLPVRKEAAGTGTSILKSLFFWHESVAFSFRRGVFFVVFPLAFVCFGIALRKRWPFLHLGVGLLIVGLFLLGSLLVDAFGSSLRSDAVVITEVQGRRGDGHNYSPSHSRPFPPGTEVTILQRREPGVDGSGSGNAEPWILVRLLDGKESWIPSGVIETVLP